MVDSLTISGLALKIFRSKYYKDNIPLINKTSMYRDIKQGYYGAITEVYKPYGEKLYYYDVNSLYPYVALQELPGIECSKESFLNTEKPIGTRIAKLVICDSISLLNSSLDNLARSYMVNTMKGIFPYGFARRNNLFYIGNTPNKSYFKSNIKQSQYNAIQNSN